MAHSGDGLGRVVTDAADADIVPGIRRRATNDFERMAVEMHGQNRRRATLFNHPVMADYPLDLLLTALIAHEQGTMLSRRAAAMANRMDLAVADAIFDRLIEAGLVERGAIEGGRARDHVRLSGHGAGLMHEYLRACNGRP